MGLDAAARPAADINFQSPAGRAAPEISRCKGACTANRVTVATHRGFRIGTLGGPETNEENGPGRPVPTRKRKEERITAAPETQSKDTKA